MSVLSLLKGAGQQIYGQVSGKQKANELYRVLVPELKEAVEMKKPFNDPQFQRLMHATIELAPSGAKRRNFERKYFEDADSIMRLPYDPNSIMYGYWW